MAASGSKSDAADGQQGNDGAQGAGELDQQLQDQLLPAVDVVLDHDLQAQAGMPEQRDHEGGQQAGAPGTGDGGTDGFTIGADQAGGEHREPGRQQGQGDGADALRPPVVDAVLGGAQALGPGQRIAQLAHAAPPRASHQRPAVSSTASTSTV